MAIGGFNNQGGNLSLAAFEQYVAKGEIHYYVASGGGGAGGPRRRRIDVEHHELGRGSLQGADRRRTDRLRPDADERLIPGRAPARASAPLRPRPERPSKPVRRSRTIAGCPVGTRARPGLTRATASARDEAAREEARTSHDTAAAPEHGGRRGPCPRAVGRRGRGRRAGRRGGASPTAPSRTPTMADPSASEPSPGAMRRLRDRLPAPLRSRWLWAPATVITALTVVTLVLAWVAKSPCIADVPRPEPRAAAQLEQRAPVPRCVLHRRRPALHGRAARSARRVPVPGVLDRRTGHAVGAGPPHGVSGADRAADVGQRQARAALHRVWRTRPACCRRRWSSSCSSTSSRCSRRPSGCSRSGASGRCRGGACGTPRSRRCRHS